MNEQRTISLIILLLFCRLGFSQDTLIIGDSIVFSESLRNSKIETLSMTSDLIVIGYYNNDSAQDVLKIGEIIDESTIDFGIEIPIPEIGNFPYPYTLSLSRIDSTSFLLVYKEDDYRISMRHCEIVNINEIQMGDIVRIDAYTTYFDIMTLKNKRFLMSYHDGYSGYWYVMLGSIIDNSTIHIINTINISGIDAYANVSIDTLNNSRFIISYGSHSGFLVAGNIQEDLLSIDTTFEYGDYMQFDASNIHTLSSSDFIIIYASTYSHKGGVFKGEINESNEIVIEGPTYFEESSAQQVKSLKINNNEVVISYNNWDSYDIEFLKTYINNDNEIAFTDKYSYLSSYSMPIFHDLFLLNDSFFGASYYRNQNIGEIRFIKNENNTSSLNEIKELKARIFPNPAKEFINIEVFDDPTPILITCRNIHGKIIYSSYGSEYKHTINIENWNHGLYFVELISGSKKYIEKVIKY